MKLSRNNKPNIYPHKVPNLTIGTLFEISHNGSEHICLTTFDGVVSLTDPKCTWFKENVRAMTCRVLNIDEIISLQNS